MKKIIGMVVIGLMLSANAGTASAVEIAGVNQSVAANSSVKLLCSGWTYMRDANGVLLNPRNTDEGNKHSQLIDIDVSSMKISTNTQYGEINANLDITDKFYSGSNKLRDALINEIMITVNRYTGEGTIFARSAEKPDWFAIFVGECQSQQKRF
jgi:hypothetical protein